MFFHGSKNKIINFSDEFIGRGHDQEGPGIYFTSSYKDAKFYGNYLYSVVLRMKKTIPEEGDLDLFREDIEYLIDNSPNKEDALSNWDEDLFSAREEAIESILEYAENPQDLFQQVWIDFYRNNPIDYVRNMVNLGYDGFYVKKRENTIHAIVFNPLVIEVKDVEESLIVKEIRKIIKESLWDKIKNFDIKKKIEELPSKTWDAAKNIKILAVREGKESALAAKILFKILKRGNVKREEVMFLKAQSIDLARIVAILGLAAISSIIPIILEKILKPYGISILPKDNNYLLNTKEDEFNN